MKKCVILSMDDSTGFAVYDHLLLAPLANAGWQCDIISWRAKNIDWNEYGLVMIRSPWDYQLDVQAFLSVLQTIENSTAHLDNPLEIVNWNINKKYLRDLEAKGIEILPTLWREHFEPAEMVDFFHHFQSQELVLKPTVGAGAFDTYRLNLENLKPLTNEIAKKFAHRAFMVQPFIENIISEGEYSVFYFDGLYSHTILKTPKALDFRVQEEHGGQLCKVEAELKLKECASEVLDAINTSLLYARLDFVRTATGFALMEAELIEPSLYFNLDAKAPQRFVEAIERRMKRKNLID